MPALIPIERVLALANPLTHWPWDDRLPGARSNVLSGFDVFAVPSLDVPWHFNMDVLPDGEKMALCHIGRIRYLLENGWTDAIDIDVGVPSMGYHGPSWPIIDGNHRLAAAALRGDSHILVDISGQLDHAARLLGVSEADLANDVCV
jgi:hypothetical protein